MAAANLGAVSRELWDELRVPRRLRLEIKGKVGSHPRNSPVLNKANSISHADSEIEGKKPEDPMEPELREDMAKISEEVAVASDLRLCLDLMMQITANAACDESKQRIKLANPVFRKRVGRYQAAIKYLVRVFLYHTHSSKIGRLRSFRRRD